MRIPADVDAEEAGAIEEAVWQRMGGEGARTIKTRRSGPEYPTGQVETIQVGGDASAGAI